MRKLIIFNMLSLDGYFEGTHEDISWHHVDDEFNEFAIEQIKEADAILFGRKTYELMAGYWPTPAAIKDDPVVAGLMNSYPKIVFSTTLKEAKWNNTRLIRDNIEREVQQLRRQPGKNLFVFGSADLSAALWQMGLIDEFRIMINPVVLGKGNPFFKNTRDKMELQLRKAKVFGNGNVLLYYTPG